MDGEAMADLHTAQMRIMLNSYEQQLLAARRLARFRAQRRLAEGLPPEDRDPAIKRRQFVQKVAHELYERLLYTGSSNPVVNEIRKELSRRLNKEIEFTYPPGGSLCIAVREPDGLRPLNEEEQRHYRDMLRSITAQKVNESMLKKPPHTGCCPEN